MEREDQSTILQDIVDWKEYKKQQDKKCCSLEIVYLGNGNQNMLFSNDVSTHLLRPLYIRKDRPL